ncbi:MAG TPA: hypothetical protein VMY39_01035 [Planctomycetota bacterium]|nr:hypothetical protein [Planctomycetota bacterium]
MMRTLACCLGVVAVAMLIGTGCSGERNSPKGKGLPTVRDFEGDLAGDGVVIEAEDFAAHGGTIEPPMEVDRVEGASGGECVIIEGGAGKPGGFKPGSETEKYPDRWGAVTYRFTVRDAGKYLFWGRVFWEDGCGNSFTLVVNGGPPLLFSGSTTDHWYWEKCSALLDLKAGENVLEVLNREDGVRLDKIIITRRLDFVPQGTE